MANRLYPVQSPVLKGGKEDERTSGFLMVAAARARRLPSLPGNTQERPLGSEVEVEAGREEEDDDA